MNYLVGSGTKHGDRTGAALGVAIADHFQPIAENYFSRVKLNVIHRSFIEACREETAAQVSKMKKKEAAAYAADKATETGWVSDLMTFSVSAPFTEEVIGGAA
ncbi:MAG: hypothetical protein K5905_27920 [Roseibium sp.]|uniref:hypothetical protein n=1 Tax=Roseibium sp. TaxID=1936156 RepID=UPI00260862BB|nr:hypothetical protein [Roseibium sp.]MCV0429295.1 hypothetical protein [Roseibium sp.]